MEFILTYIAIGFFTVFGWNSGQKVWDNYVEAPKVKIEQVKTDTNEASTR
jgi:hypothetical protein